MRTVDRPKAEGEYEDHFLADYSPVEIATLNRVLAFNRELVDAFEGGKDVRAVTRFIDPDPGRYMSVSEGDGEIGRDLDAASRLIADAPFIEGHQRRDSHVLSNVENGSAPTVAVAADGRILLGWIEWIDGVGEQINVVLLDASGSPLGPPAIVSGDPADCFRPSAIFDSTGTPWVFYGISGDRGAEIRACQFTSNGWSAPITISTNSPAFNQEVISLDAGSLVSCWQQWADDRFAILSSRYTDGRWSAPKVINGDEDDNVWDPVVAATPDGRLTFAWCSYRDGSYTVVARSESGGRLGVERPLSEGTDYSMHPTLACTAAGEVWCAFDRITVQAHGGSGTTRLRATKDVSDSAPIDGVLPPGRHFPKEGMLDIQASVELVRIDDNALFRVAGVGSGLDVMPAAYPRLASTADGGLAIAFRVIRRFPVLTYYWEVAVQTLGVDGLSGVMTFSGSDGTVEEPAIAGGTNGAVVVWQDDGRREKALSWTEGFGGRECVHLKHHYGGIVWHSVHDGGQISFGMVESPGPARTGSGDKVELVTSSRRREARPWIGTKPDRYRTSVGGASYLLFWGDLHRHSLISRCTVADEPSLDDYYRFAKDIYAYDFWALTDHAEHTSAQQWWSIQKAADLLQVDRAFAPLYGFEWTSKSGHQNVIFGPCKRGAPIISAFAEGSDAPDKLWQLLRAHPDFPALTIPHHPGSAMTPFDWSYYDPEFVRLVEIFQACRGNYEADGCFRQYNDATLPGTFVVDGLKRNYRFGLIASTDHGFGASYVGVYADRLDRGAIFEALRARRTFAATTRGIVVDFRVGDTFMGGEVNLSTPAELTIYASGYRELSRLEIVRNGETVHRVSEPPTLPDGSIRADIRIEWGQNGITTDWSGFATVEGGEFLQSEFWAPEVTAVANTRIEWRSTVPNFGGNMDAPSDGVLGAGGYGLQRSGVEVTVVGPPTAVINVSTGPASLAATLADLASGVFVQSVGENGARLRLQPGTGALMGMGCTEKRITWIDGSDEPAWYYVRAILTDGEMAWSSPIWVDRN